MRQLPIFRGYTVDVRLFEFRKVVRGKRPVFIPFNSPKGKRLFAEWIETPRAWEEFAKTA